MARYVNTTERLTHDDVARELVKINQPRLAAAVRGLEADATAQWQRYRSLLDDYTQLQLRLNPRGQPEHPVSYKPSPMSDG